MENNDVKENTINEHNPSPDTANKDLSVKFGEVRLLATPDLKPDPDPESDNPPPASILRKSKMSEEAPETTFDAIPKMEDVTDSGSSNASIVSNVTPPDATPRAITMTETLSLPVRPHNRSKINKPFINFIVTGHIDAGKSTLIGHLIYLCKGIDKETMNRLSREADLAGKASFKYAWVMDKLKAERQRGVSIDSKLRRFELEDRFVVIIDAPGHRDYIHNMLTGTSQADAAILVVSAERGEFESGVKRSGQTREHLHLVYTMGLKQLIVVVNKMETTEPPYSEVRFNNIVTIIKQMAKRIGYELDAIVFIPVSAFDGDNLVKASENLPWFDMWSIKRKSGGASGKTLLEALQQTDIPGRLTYRPLRVPIHSVYKLGETGIVTAGRVHSGSIKPNMEVTFAPNNVKAKVKAVQMYREVMTEVISGDNVGIQLENKTIKEIRKGDVCGDTNDEPPKCIDQFTAQILVLSHPGAIKKGYTPILNVHTATVACKFIEIKERCDRRTGQTVEKSPSCLQPGEVGVVELQPLKPLSLECFFDYPSLGRICIRDLKQTVAIGVVIDLPGRVVETDDDKVKNRLAGHFGADETDGHARPTTTGPSTPRQKSDFTALNVNPDPGLRTFRTGSGKLESEL